MNERISVIEFAFSSTEASKVMVGIDVIGSTEMEGLKYDRVLMILSKNPAFCSNTIIARRILLHRASMDLMPNRSTYRSRIPLHPWTASWMADDLPIRLSPWITMFCDDLIYPIICFNSVSLPQKSCRDTIIPYLNGFIGSPIFEYFATVYYTQVNYT